MLSHAHRRTRYFITFGLALLPSASPRPCPPRMPPQLHCDARNVGHAFLAPEHFSPYKPMQPECPASLFSVQKSDSRPELHLLDKDTFFGVYDLILPILPPSAASVKWRRHCATSSGDVAASRYSERAEWPNGSSNRLCIPPLGRCLRRAKFGREHHRQRYIWAFSAPQ